MGESFTKYSNRNGRTERSTISREADRQGQADRQGLNWGWQDITFNGCGGHLQTFPLQQALATPRCPEQLHQ